MDYFSFMNNDLSTPIGLLVKAGTDSLLIGPDWSKNLEICDLVSGTKDGPEHGVRAIHRRLQDNDPNTVFLALIIMEACMKNCGVHFAGVVNKSLLDEIANIARGSKGIKNSSEALRLIQQWGRAFESSKRTYPLFFDTFIGLKSRGIKFPKEEEAASNIFDPPEKIKSP
jgi:hypothetical protein